VDKDSVFEFSAEENRRLSKLTDNLQQPILVQEFVSGWEVEVPVFSGDTALALDPVGISVGQSPQMGDPFLDHAAAYEGTYQFFDFSKSEPVLSEHRRKAAVRAVQVLGLAGIARNRISNVIFWQGLHHRYNGKAASIPPILSGSPV
jgi:D-alanine-D-alanine ligase